MSFPAKRGEHESGDGLFVVQDPQLRSKILPLFSFDPRSPSERPRGHGTAFRIDPWGGCATAFHVVEELLKVENGRVLLRDDIRLTALEFERIGYGLIPMPKGSWRPFSGMHSFCGIETPPLAKPRIRNSTELAALSISRSAMAHGPTMFLPLDIRRWLPTRGARVMALGFADLDLDHRDEGDARAMTQYLYASEATIIEVQPLDASSSRPWPIFRVEAEWPGGMSGGPVFNEAGHVIGVVSTGVVGAGIGTAVSFAGWDAPEKTFSGIDASNPGWIKCWAALDECRDIVGIAQTRNLLEPLFQAGKAQEIGFVALNSDGTEHILL